MSAKYLGVNIALERALYDALGWLARREGVSRSTKARNLLRDALERHEDLALAVIASERERTVGAKPSTHAAVWSRVPEPKQR